VWFHKEWRRNPFFCYNVAKRQNSLLHSVLSQLVIYTNINALPILTIVSGEDFFVDEKLSLRLFTHITKLLFL